MFGTDGLDGAQAEYVSASSLCRYWKFARVGLTILKVRVPLADSTVVKAPPDIADNALVLMADIFPTGFFAAKNAFKGMSAEQVKEATVVVTGCG